MLSMSDIDRHSQAAHAAYMDLLRSLQEEAVCDIQGTPTRLERNGRGYWYDSYRVGTASKKRYLGEDTERLRELLAADRDKRGERRERERYRSRLVRLLRAEGFLGTDAATGSLLNALAAPGVFRLGGTIVGTHAFRLYEGELGVRYRFDDTAQTNDIDIASFERLSLALKDTVSTSLSDVFSDLEFSPVPSLDRHKVWKWKQSRTDFLIEFLTPSFDETEGLRPLAALGVEAQSLHYLNYLLADPLQAAAIYRSGVLVQIPRPERYAIHKLIVASRRHARSNPLKSQKDRRQAAFLIEILAEDRPGDLLEALETARERGPKWRKNIDASLAKMPEERDRLEAL
ncbi:MAG: GSU2403 family nucleotidyltransferase fold protein [Pseudomonadota bacterium]